MNAWWYALICLGYVLNARAGFVLGRSEGDTVNSTVYSQAYGTNSSAATLAFDCGNECKVKYLWCDEVTHNVFYVTEADAGGGSITMGNAYRWRYGGSIGGEGIRHFWRIGLVSFSFFFFFLLSFFSNSVWLHGWESVEFAFRVLCLVPFVVLFTAAQ
jgi:hypothetical protein